MARVTEPLNVPVVEIRPEQPADATGVERVLIGAFGEEQGVQIVEVLRDLRVDDDLEVGLVAEVDGAVSGYVALSRAWVDARERLVDVLVLSPLAVLPGVQGAGVGSALIEAALVAGEDVGAPLVFLEGSPSYYAAHGFVPAAQHGLVRPSARIPEAACQVALLTAYEPWMTGGLLYPDCFWRRDLVGLRDPVLAEMEATPPA